MKTFFLITLLFSFSLASPLRDVMKKELKPAFQEVSKILRTGQITDKSKKAAQQLFISFTQIKDMVPEYIPTPDRQNLKKPDAQDIEDFKTYMRDMIQLSEKLVQAIDTNNVDEIKKIVMLMDSHRKKAHDRFADK